MTDVITNNLDLWATAILKKSTAGRGSNGKQEAYGIKKLRELILELAVRGKLVPQDPNDEPASVLLETIETEKTRLIKEGKSKKKKLQPEVSEDEKLFTVPHGWSWIRMGEVVEIVRGITFPASEKSKEPEKGRIACLRTSNVQDSIEWDDLLFIREQYVKREDQFIREKDIVMSMANSRELVGKVAIVEKEPAYKTSFGGFLGVIRPIILNPYYIMVLLRTPINRSLLIDSASQTTNIANISLGKLNPLALAIPPLKEQHRIVAKVDELMALCDQLEQQQTDSIDAHQTLVATLLGTLTNVESAEELAEAWTRIADHFDTLFTSENSIDQLKKIILELAMKGFLVEQAKGNTTVDECINQPGIKERGKIKLGRGVEADLDKAVDVTEKPFKLPVGWKWIRLGKIIEITGGSQPPKSKFIHEPREGYTRLIQIRDFKSDEYLTFVPNEFANRPFNEEDIMIGRYGPPVFQILRGKSGTYNVALMKADPVGDCVTKDFLFYLLSEPRIQNLVISESERTAGQSGVRKELLYMFCIGLPPISEQILIVKKIEKLMALCDALKSRLADTQTTQIHLADAIVEQAVA